MENLYDKLAGLAGRTDRVVSRDALDRIKVTEQRRRTLVGQLLLTVLHEGVYLVGGGSPTWRQRARAAFTACGEKSWLSHVTALRWWGFAVPEDDTSIHISNTRTAGFFCGVVVHRPRRAVKVVERDGVRVASIEDALLDFAATTDRATLEVAVESALLSKKTHERRIWRVIVANSRKGVSGVALLRHVMEHRPKGKPARSVLEIEVLSEIRRAHLPLPTRNHEVVDGDGKKREIDLCYVEQLGAIEADSKAFHSTATQAAADARRQRALEAVGFQFVRVTWADAFERPEWIVEQVRDLLGVRRVAGQRHRHPEAS
jgi:hypothetical protein